MDSKALYNLSYGIFLLGAKSNGKINACITNTCMQVASDPVRVAISVINNKVYSLPSTGGRGIYWYLIGGMLLMMAASLILYKNKCKEVLKS